MSSREQQYQQTVQRLAEASQRVTQAQDEQERTQWANRARQYATELASGAKSQKTAVTVDCEVPSPESFQKIAEGLQRSQTPGLKELSFRQDGGRTHIRIQATREALPRIQEVMNSVGQHMQQAFSGSSSSFSS